MLTLVHAVHVHKTVIALASVFVVLIFVLKFFILTLLFIVMPLLLFIFQHMQVLL
jgi:hypothetical protein